MAAEQESAPALVRLAGLLGEFEKNISPEYLSQLLGIERRLWRRFLSAKPQLADEMPGVLPVAWGWVVHTFRQAHTVARLHRIGMGDVSLASARSAMEHGIYLSLLASHDPPEEVLKQLSDSYMKVYDILLNAGDIPSDVLDLLAGVREEIPEMKAGEWAKRIEEVCKRLETGDTVYRFYRVISSQVHPGFGSAQEVLQTFVRDRTMAHAPKSPHPPTGLWIAIGAAAWAGWSYDRMFRASTFTELLDREVRPLRFLPLVEKPKAPKRRSGKTSTDQPQ